MRRQPQFTHASLDDFRVIRDNLASGNRSTRDRLMPYCLFTDPQLAHVGLQETEARRRGIAVRIARLPMRSVLRALTIDETHGFMKALIDPSIDRILGFTMIGPEAGEVLAVVQMAMLAGFPYTVLRDAILTHPTMAEGLNGLLSISKTTQAKTSHAKGSREQPAAVVSARDAGLACSDGLALRFPSQVLLNRQEESAGVHDGPTRERACQRISSRRRGRRSRNSNDDGA